ncbi:uncharacterized protein LOC123976386 [Micropterus dolomieu]|uniref:uncharacterized protein LOC123976386 n=1 Tax=Micropterus dolomieu TaxID=147949 RepID=UPI001E8DC9CC|nr:uncharacterized protein LOC123976386 [Micropterus dolomieu]
MAEEGSVYELEGLEKQLQSLLCRYSSDELRADSKPFCSDFCKLVEEHASRWQVPLPQLGILETALCYFARASTFFTSNCDHVHHTLSSLALSVFELLLFFDQKDFHQEPLKQFAVTFQECALALARHQNVHLLQVERLVQGNGPWASPALQAILSESSLPQSEVDGCISSELPVFFELRVHYLLSCERVSEAMALAKCCAWHPTAGQHLFFLQVYLTWLSKTSQYDSLHKEVADLNGKDAIHIICSLECEEKDELLLALSRAFLSEQLHRGDMYHLCDLVFIWSKLHSRLNTSKQALLEESRQLMLSATNVSSIFPFIRAILQELGEDGIQFCVELCANALESCLPCDVVTKSLIYKTIAGLLPNDLEVCRACALLVFFLERTVEAYKMVYLLYMHPDQEYHVEYSPIRNHIRFETLQILKKDLYFDPEFWNLIALRTNCLKLMSEKVVSAALEEIMEDKWILNYCTKEPALRSSSSACHNRSKGALQVAAKKRHHKEDRHRKEDTDAASKRLKVGTGKTRLHCENTVKKKGKDSSSEPLRRSFWQLDKLQDNVAVGYGDLRRTTRLSEKNPPKRRIRTPKWLLEDSGTLEGNNVSPKIKRHGLKHRSSAGKRSETDQVKNSAKHKPSVNSDFMARENRKNQKGFSLDCQKTTTPPQVILELSLPDNELMGTFIEDTCNRQRGFPQVLFYKPTVKLPATSQPVKTVHRKEVILRARDPVMFAQQLHCYARRQKGKGNGLNIQGSVSTITRSSVQGSPPKDPQRELCGKPAAEMISSQTSATAEETESPIIETILQAHSTRKVLQTLTSTRELPEKPAAEMKATKTSQTATEVTEPSMLNKALQAQTITSARELCEESAVEMKVTIASQTPKVTQSAGLDKVSNAQTITDASKTSAEVSQTSPVNNNQTVVTDEIPPVSNMATMSIIGAAGPKGNGKQQVMSLSSLDQTSKNPGAQAKAGTAEVLPSVRNSISDVDVTDVSLKLAKGHVACEKNTSLGETMVTLSKTEVSYSPTDQDSINDISALTLVTEMVTELAPGALSRDLENHKQPAPEDSTAKESSAGSKPKVAHNARLRTTSSCSASELGASAVADAQGKKVGTQDSAPEASENDEPIDTSEEAKLEYCCTFCNKVFMGRRVVAHAMFHYRKDECMFCGTMFKDDLLAMMHLSNHIEKLKKSKGSAGNTAQQNGVSETKDISTPKTSAKVKSTTVSSGRRSSGRQRKSAVCPKSVSLPDSTPSGARKLRSNDKSVDGSSLQEKKENASTHLSNKAPVYKVNGHIAKKKMLDRPKKDALNSEAKQPLTQQKSGGAENPKLQENQETEMDSSATSALVDTQVGRSTEGKIKSATKHDGKVVEEKNVEPEEKLCCPVDGCVWFTDLSKNRVALLYHALEDHYGEVKPLELAFHVGNSRCSICMRVLWSFEHFQHHVERHRLAPRHPCPHQGCTARFKTGMEMRRHARRHSPLQAVCCLPGCSQLFICLWALNLHEREHYASKPTKPDKNTDEQTGDKHNTTLAGKKHLDLKPKDDICFTTVNKTVIAKASRKSRQTANNSSTEKQVSAPLSTVRASLLKQKLKENRERKKDSHVLKNLSNKDTSSQPTVPNLRLRQTLRKVTNTTLTTPKTLKVISSSLLKHNIKVRHKFKKKQVKVNTKGPKRRGRPPKAKKPLHDENTTAGQNNETVKDKTAPQKDQKSNAQPASLPKAAETSSTSNTLQEEEKCEQIQDEVKNRGTSSKESESKKSVNKQVKTNHIKQKGVSHNTSTAILTANSLNQSVTTTTSADKTQKLTTDKMKKPHEAKKRPAPKETSSQSESSDFCKSIKHKVTNSKANTEIVKKKCPLKEPESASKKNATSKAVVPHEATAKRKAENKDSTQNSSDNSAPATSGEKTLKVPTEGKLNKPHKEGKKEKKNNATSSDSGKQNKKHKDVNKKGDKKAVKDRRPCKDASKTSAFKKAAKSKSVDQQVEANTAESSPGVEGKAKEETLDATPDTPCSSIPAATASSLDETTSPCTATEENMQKVTKKEKDPNKAKKKRKDVHKEGAAKAVKNNGKDQGVPSASKKPAKSKIQVQPKLVESSAGEEGNASAETAQSTISGAGYAVVTNGQPAREEVKSTVCKDTLAEYGKRPYMRLPPTAYLDEKYITMPKRRKEMPFHSSPSPPRQQAKVTAVLQRQRCANCFATFNSAEDLQSHVQLQKCSNLFGFDSDDEGNS